MSIWWATFTISALSEPMRGRNTGRSATASVQAMAWMVWLATWPRLSPVMRAAQPSSRATRWAARSMNRRRITVDSSSGHLSRISSWRWVKFTVTSLMRPAYSLTFRRSRTTFSWASSLV